MNVKRWTICVLLGHKWVKVPYAAHEDTGFYVRCRVCNYENHDVSSRPASILWGCEAAPVDRADVVRPGRPSDHLV